MKLTPEIQVALKRAIDHYGNTSQFAKHIGIAHSTVLFWLSGKTANISGHIWVSKVRRELRPFLENPEADLHSVREEQEPFFNAAVPCAGNRAPLLNFSLMRDFDSTLESPVSFVKRKSGETILFANEIKDSFFALTVDDRTVCSLLPVGTRLLVSGAGYAQDGDVVVGKLRQPATLVFCHYNRLDDRIRLTPLQPGLPVMEWLNGENAEKVFWLYPVEEISIDLQNRKWENGELIVRE